MKNFQNKVVVITGAASGMGREYALAFARRGSKVAICDWDEAGLAETEKLTRAAGAKELVSAKVDVGSRDAIYAFADAVKAKLGNAHVVINNAGISGEGEPVWRLSDEGMHRIMNINFWGVVHGTRAFLPQMKANGEGAVVNVSSIFGLQGTPGNADYCATKFAVRGFTEALAVELTDTPIQVHCVHPGGIKTNIVRTEREKPFEHRFLKTPASDMVAQVIRGIEENNMRVIYGHDSLRVSMGVRLLPFAFMRKLIRKEMNAVLNADGQTRFTF